MNGYHERNAMPLTWPTHLQMLVPPLPGQRPVLRDCGGPLVVLLHGLWRSHHAMEPLASALHRIGFSTLNLPYASTRKPIATLCHELSAIIHQYGHEREIYLVTHSLGGILARAMIANHQLTPSRLVMLAPPNQGSEIVDALSRWPLAASLLGHAGRELGTQGAPARLPAPPPSVETMVIMGRLSSIPIFRRLLRAENDGIVTVHRGQLPNIREFHVVDADHTFIQIHPDTIRLCTAFLQGPSKLTTDPTTAS